MGGKKGQRQDGRHDSPPPSPPPGADSHPPPPVTDIATILRWMDDRDERRREMELQREETRREEEKLRFEALLATLALTHPPSLAGSALQGTSTLPPPPHQRPPAPKASVQPPPALSPDVTFQLFREWRRRWTDYSTMVDLDSMPPNKQLIQLRMCLSLETQRVLEHTLHVPPDSTSSVTDVLDLLQEHVKGRNNEALRRRAFTSCKQAENESFDDFFVRLKSLSEEIDVCKAHSRECEEAWIKHGILTGVRHEELMQRLIPLDASSTLQVVVTECRSYEATKSATSALRAPPAVRAISQYKKDKKAANNAKAATRSSTPPPSASCGSCGKQHSPKTCPAADALCRGCDRKGHWSNTDRCPARGHKCEACGRYGHYDKCCRQPKPKSPRRGGQQSTSLGVVRTQPPPDGPRSPKQQRSHIRRVESTTRSRATPSPTIRVAVTHGDVSGHIEVIPDTGADTTVIGLKHLQKLGLTKRDLGPPPQLLYYNADGCQMPDAVGSFQAVITFGDRSCHGWIDVRPTLATPLLSWEHCKELGVVPRDFPEQIPAARYTASRVRELTSDAPGTATQSCPEPASTPTHTGRSPAQILYGHPLRSCVPAHVKAFAKDWQTRAESCDCRAASRAQDAKARYDDRARPLQPVEIGALVRVQDPTTTRWDKVGIVMGVGQSRDYKVRMPSGRVWWRNRRFLRPVPPPAAGPLTEDESPTPHEDPPHSAPRRSERLRTKKSAQDKDYERKGGGRCRLCI